MRWLVVVSLALTATLAVAAVAHARGVTSSLTIATHNDPGPHGFLNGKLKSTKASCQKGVKVKLYYKSKKAGFPDFEKVASDKTDVHGKWHVDGPRGSVPNGKYYAKTKADHPCPAVKTSKVTVTDGT